MIRFITKILLISTFFIGLGAIADGILKTVIPTSAEICETKQIRIIKVTNNSNERQQFRMILPNIDVMTAQKKIEIFRTGKSVK